MDPALEKKLRATFAVEVEDVLPLRQHKVQFRGTHEIMINAIAADRVFILDQKRSPLADLPERQRQARQAEVKLYEALSKQKDGVIISENFAAIHGLDKGDTLTLTSTKKGEVSLTIIGKVVDYSWNHGTVFIHLPVFLANWNDHGVDIFDVYLRHPSNIETAKTVKKSIANTHGLWVSDRAEVQAQIDSMIERLYGIAYGQQIVVMFIALVGVVTALLISVLQRRREMGLLRAIGASRWQVIRSVLAEAALMGVLGTTIGIVMGIPLQWYVLKVAILEESGYLFPVHIPWLESLVIAVAAIVAATLAGLGPAVHSVRQRIPDAIAYE
jgi:putative ABC transport system permease protein